MAPRGEGRVEGFTRNIERKKEREMEAYSSSARPEHAPPPHPRAGACAISRAVWGLPYLGTAQDVHSGQSTCSARGFKAHLHYHRPCRSDIQFADHPYLTPAGLYPGFTSTDFICRVYDNLLIFIFTY